MGAASDPVQLATRGGAHAARTRVAFVVTGLHVGGAEMMLWKLLSRIDRARFEPCVIALSAGATEMVPAFRRLGIDCEVLGWRSGRAIVGGIPGLARALRARKPDLVQGWMYHGNLAATLASAWARLHVPVLWNVRATLMDRRHEKRTTLFAIWLGGKLSSTAARVINNSVASALEHERQMGYAAARRVVLPNGFDVERFRPAPECKAKLRREIGAGKGEVVVGMVARYHPMKGHEVFLRAAGAVARAHPNVSFVLVGQGVDAANDALSALVREHGLAGRVHLLGRQADMAAITAGFDIAVSSSSSGEGFSNAIGEAMSCAVPCVVTDVGDARAIVGATGIVVAPGDARALADAVAGLVDAGAAGRAELGERARRRAVDEFSLDAVVRQYEALYTRVIEERRSA